MKTMYKTPEVNLVHVMTEVAFLGSTTQNGTGADVTWNGSEEGFDSYFGS